MAAVLLIFPAALVANLKAFILPWTHMKQQHSCKEGLSLAIANVFIIDRIGLEKRKVKLCLKCKQASAKCVPINELFRTLPPVPEGSWREMQWQDKCGQRAGWDFPSPSSPDKIFLPRAPFPPLKSQWFVCWIGVALIRKRGKTHLVFNLTLHTLQRAERMNSARSSDSLEHWALCTGTEHSSILHCSTELSSLNTAGICRVFKQKASKKQQFSQRFLRICSVKIQLKWCPQMKSPV